MVNVNDKEFIYYSMPIHDPLYKHTNICHRGDVVRITLEVERPEVIANLIPKPLVYNDNKIFIDVNVIKELKKGFPEDYALWIELGIKMPVTYNGELKTYLCELYANNIFVLFVDREHFGMPRVPGLITAEKNGKNFKVKLSDYASNRDIFNISFKPLKGNPAPQGPPAEGLKKKKMPKLIWLKYIPSVTLDYHHPDVKKLVEMTYGKPPVVLNTTYGEGNFELLESAPSYLKEAVIVKTVEAVYHDMQFDVIGGTVLHNYI